MKKIALPQQTGLFPMPTVLVGAMVNGRPNFLAVAWVSWVNYQPPMIAVALGRTHHTTPGIHATKSFSVNIPGCDLVDKVDYCGMVSGKKDDKSTLFTVTPGEKTGAPLIDECPVSLECRVVRTVDLGADELIIGDIAGIYADPACLTNRKPDVEKMKPFLLTMPDNRYWGLGEVVAKAWSAGKNIKR